MSETVRIKRTDAVVVKVVNAHKIILNKGSEDGVSNGQGYLVYELGEEIIDPGTGKSLGKIEVVKGRGKVVYVQKHMSHLESIEVSIKKTRNRSGFIGMLDAVNEEITDAPFDGVSLGDICRPI